MDKKWARTINFSLIFLAWTGVIILKYVKPETSLKVPIFISSIISIVALVIMFGKKLNFNKDDEPITKLSKEQMMKIIEKEAHENWWNNLRPHNPFPNKMSDTINNNLIYAYWVKLNLEDEGFIIVINASHPELEPSVYPEYDKEGKILSETKIKELMNKKSINPYKEANREISEETIDQFGKPIRRTERISQPEQEKEEEKNNV